MLLASDHLGSSFRHHFCEDPCFSFVHRGRVGGVGRCGRFVWCGQCGLLKSYPALITACVLHLTIARRSLDRNSFMDSKYEPQVSLFGWGLKYGPLFGDGI